MVGGMKVERVALEEVAMAEVVDLGGGSEDDCVVCKVVVEGVGNGEAGGWRRGSGGGG